MFIYEALTLATVYTCIPTVSFHKDFSWIATNLTGFIIIVVFLVYISIHASVLEGHATYVHFTTISTLIFSLITQTFYYLSLHKAFSLLCSTVSVFLLFFVHSEVYSVLILCLYKVITVPEWNVIQLLVVEIYPTSLRLAGIRFTP